MDKLSNRQVLFSLIFGVLIISGLLILTFFTCNWVYFSVLKILKSLYLLLIKNLELTKILVPAIAAIIVASISLIGIFLGRYLEKKREIENNLRIKKIEIYQKFINFLFDEVFNSIRKGSQIDTDKMGDFYFNYVKDLILWASDKVLLEYNKFFTIIRNSQNNTDAFQEYLFSLEKLLFEIRKDTGHKNKGFKKGEILKSFIVDIDQFLQ